MKTWCVQIWTNCLEFRGHAYSAIEACSEREAIENAMLLVLLDNPGADYFTHCYVGHTWQHAYDNERVLTCSMHWQPHRNSPFCVALHRAPSEDP